MNDDAILEVLKGRCWVPLRDIRTALKWREGKSPLLAAVKRLKAAGKIETKEPGELGFAVRLPGEVTP